MKTSEVYLFHSIPFCQIKPGVLIPDPRYSSESLRPAYRWLESEIGFYPLFLAVGNEEAVYATGYRDLIDRRRDLVLFGMPLDAVQGVTIHAGLWNRVIGDICSGYEPSQRHARLCFRRWWSRARWLAAAQNGNLVQMVAPQIDLAHATLVWAQDEQTTENLQLMGFHQAETHSYPCED